MRGERLACNTTPHLSAHVHATKAAAEHALNQHMLREGAKLSVSVALFLPRSVSRLDTFAESEIRP